MGPSTVCLGCVGVPLDIWSVSLSFPQSYLSSLSSSALTSLSVMAMSFHIFRSPPSPPPPPSKGLWRKLVPLAAVPISNAQTRERQKMKDLFREARERCVSDPMDGVSFTVDDFHRALDDQDFGTGVGCKVSRVSVSQ